MWRKWNSSKRQSIKVRCLNQVDLPTFLVPFLGFIHHPNLIYKHKSNADFIPKTVVPGKQIEGKQANLLVFPSFEPNQVSLKAEHLKSRRLMNSSGHVLLISAIISSPNQVSGSCSLHDSMMVLFLSPPRKMSGAERQREIVSILYGRWVSIVCEMSIFTANFWCFGAGFFQMGNLRIVTSFCDTIKNVHSRSANSLTWSFLSLSEILYFFKNKNRFCSLKTLKILALNYMRKVALGKNVLQNLFPEITLVGKYYR